MDRPGRLGAVVLIGTGGFAGAVLRHLTAIALPASVPWGTLAANVAGAFLLGLLLSEGRLADLVGADVRLLVGTGFCSSLTTFSTFAAETAALPPALAGANVVGTYALGFGAILLGGAVARWTA